MHRNEAFRWRSSCVQAGATMVELVISLPIFIMLIFIIAELSLMYQAKLVVDLASLTAARTGAVMGGDGDKMKEAAILALAPLYAMGSDHDPESANEAFDNAAGKARKDVESETTADGQYKAKGTMNFDLKAKGTMNSDLTHMDEGVLLNAGKGDPEPASVLMIEILSPTKEMMNDFGVDRKTGNSEEKVIPNDNLMYRRTDPGSSGANIQDANLLKIKLTYLYELKMPLTKLFFTPMMDANIARRMFGKSEVRAVSDDSSGRAQELWEKYQFRIPLVSYAMVRMQSDMKEASLKGDSSGSGSGNPPATGLVPYP